MAGCKPYLPSSDTPTPNHNQEIIEEDNSIINKENNVEKNFSSTDESSIINEDENKEVNNEENNEENITNEENINTLISEEEAVKIFMNAWKSLNDFYENSTVRDDGFMNPPQGLDTPEVLAEYFKEYMSGEIATEFADFLIMDFFNDGNYVLRPTEQLATVYWGISETTISSITENEFIIKEYYKDELLGDFERTNHFKLIDDKWLLVDIIYER